MNTLNKILYTFLITASAYLGGCKGSEKNDAGEDVLLSNPYSYRENYGQMFSSSYKIEKFEMKGPGGITTHYILLADYSDQGPSAIVGWCYDNNTFSRISVDTSQISKNWSFIGEHDLEYNLNDTLGLESLNGCDKKMLQHTKKTLEHAVEVMKNPQFLTNEDW
ncbi:MAG: hypothetical protein ACP5NV_06155 [Candidatus Woesearchaeota archaeon]